ncbi:MAG: hypothetical protein WD512_12215, partial [Candidatus Paceibacterota bacterium]
MGEKSWIDSIGEKLIQDVRFCVGQDSYFMDDYNFPFIGRRLSDFSPFYDGVGRLGFITSGIRTT